MALTNTGKRSSVMRPGCCSCNLAHSQPSSICKVRGTGSGEEIGEGTMAHDGKGCCEDLQAK
jgi:hypothetical protein